MITDKSDNRVLALTAFILFLIGFFLPFLTIVLMVLFRPFHGALSLVFAALTVLPAVAELLALMFGLMSWRSKLGKTAAFGAVLFWTLYVINLFRFYHGR